MSHFWMTDRRRKIIREGVIYHITQRAPGRELLFVEDEDYLSFLSLVKKISKEMGIKIFAFCLLPNHYHLLLKLNRPNLSKAMQRLNTAYSMRFNDKYCRKGHVFCGVYRATICDNDFHLLACSFYIHLNPWKAGLTDEVFKYRWSSLDIYLKPGIKSFVDSQFVLNMIEDNLTKACSRYRKMMSDYADLVYENVLENPKAVRNFAREIIKKFKGKLLQKHCHEFLKDIALEEQIERFRFCKNKKNVKSKPAVEYLIEQLKIRGYKMNEIAEILGITRQHLYRIIKCDKKG